nr:auxin-responsive protein SAUR40-like [Lolium perenne]
MAMWRKKETAVGASGAAPACVVIRSAGTGKIPRGYIPMVLVGDEGEEEERVMVHVRMLTEPHVLDLLEMSAQQFGYGQRGVLRVPCGVERFEQTVCAGHQQETQDPACAAAH